MDREERVREVIKYYGSIAQISYKLHVTPQAIYKTLKDDNAFSPAVAIGIERDTQGRFRAVELAA